MPFWIHRGNVYSPGAPFQSGVITTREDPLITTRTGWGSGASMRLLSPSPTAAGQVPASPRRWLALPDASLATSRAPVPDFYTEGPRTFPRAPPAGTARRPTGPVGRPGEPGHRSSNGA